MTAVPAGCLPGKELVIKALNLTVMQILLTRVIQVMIPYILMPCIRVWKLALTCSPARSGECKNCEASTNPVSIARFGEYN